MYSDFFVLLSYSLTVYPYSTSFCSLLYKYNICMTAVFLSICPNLLSLIMTFS